MVIGNKLDLADESRAISSDTAREWCKQNGNIAYIETSAKEDKNVEDAFIKLATQALRRQQDLAKSLDDTLSGQRNDKKKLKLEKNQQRNVKEGSCSC